MPVQDRHSRGRNGRDSPGDSRSPKVVPAKVARIEGKKDGRTSAVAVAAAGQPATLLMPRRGTGHAQEEEFEEIEEPAGDADMGSLTPGTPVVDLSLEDGQGKGQGKDKDEKAKVDMAKLVAAHLDEQSEKFGQSVLKALQPEILSLVQGTVVVGVDELQGKITNVENGLASLDIGVTALGEDVSNVKGDLKNLEATMLSKFEELSKEIAKKREEPLQPPGNVASAPMSSNSANGNPSPSPQPANVFNLSGFFRALDPTILFCNTMEQKKVARAKFHDAIIKLAAEAGLGEDTFDLLGDALDNEFEIDWNPVKINDVNIATENCRRFFSSMRSRKGKKTFWKPQNVLDDQGQLVQFFVKTDKNPSMVRKEILTKSMQDLCQQKFAGTEVFANRPNGSLFVDRKLLCTVHVTGENSARLEWNKPICVLFKFEYAVVEEEFKALLLNRGQSCS